jgi:hypothetical protein
MVKTSTQNIVSSTKNHESKNLNPTKAVLSFLVNYSKALEIKKLKDSPQVEFFKN